MPDPTTDALTATDSAGDSAVDSAVDSAGDSGQVEVDSRGPRSCLASDSRHDPQRASGSEPASGPEPDSGSEPDAAPEAETGSPSRFARLLLAFIGLFVTTTSIAELREHSGTRQMAGWINAVEPLAYAVVLVTAVWAIAEGVRMRIITGVLAVTAIALGTIAAYFETQPLALAQDIGTLVFLTFIVVLMVRHLFACREVDLDTIACSICVYLTLGLLYLAAYSLVVDVNPSAFDYTVSVPEGQKRLSISSDRSAHGLYFSFVTLTTLGYGDIAPRSPIARMLAASEAVVGQIFLTVLVARLVGLHLAAARDEMRGRRHDDDMLQPGAVDESN